MRIFPQSFVHGLFLSLKDLYIVVMSASTLLSFLAIKSYSVFDNSINASAPQLTKNWLGWGGAYFADMCWQFLGIFAYAVPFILGLFALRAAMSYFNRFLVCSFKMLTFGIFQFSIALTYYQNFVMSGFKPVGGALGSVTLKSLERFLDSYQLKDWLEEFVFIIGLCGFFCIVFGLGITETHIKSIRTVLKKGIAWVQSRFTVPNEYMFNRPAFFNKNINIHFLHSTNFLLI